MPASTSEKLTTFSAAGAVIAPTSPHCENFIVIVPSCPMAVTVVRAWIGSPSACETS